MMTIMQYNDSRVLPQWVSKFLSSDSLAKKEAKKVYKLMTAGPRTIGFKNETGWMWLQTFTSFKPGTSVAHFDSDAYTQTCDFMMAPSVQGSTGMSMEQLSLKRCGYDSLGPNVLSLLETLGWSTKNGLDSNVSAKVIATATMDSGSVPTGGTQQPNADGDAWIKFMLGGLLGALSVTAMVGGYIYLKRKRLTRGKSVADESMCDLTPKEILSSRIVKTVKTNPLPPEARDGIMPPPPAARMQEAHQAPAEVLSKSLRPVL